MNIPFPWLAALAAGSLPSTLAGAPADLRLAASGKSPAVQSAKARMRQPARDPRLLGIWVMAEAGCASDGVRYAFYQDGTYVTDGEFGTWSTAGARIRLEHEEGVNLGAYSLAKRLLTIRFDGLEATRYARCAARAEDEAPKP